MTFRDGRRRVRFGDVVRQVKDGADPESSGLVRYVAGEHMDTDELQITRWGTIGDGYLGPAFHRHFRSGQVLYGSRRTYLRKVALADFDGICANTTFVCETKDPAVLLPEFLPYVMQASSFHSHSVRQSKGSVNPYINWPDLAWYAFDLPPPDEQHAIAQLLRSAEISHRAITALLTKLDAVRAATFDSRTKSAQHITVGELVDAGVLLPPQDGNHGEKHPKSSDFRAEGIPFLTASDVSVRRIDVVDCKFISEPLARSLRVGFANEGDVLLTHKGSVGATAIVPKTPFPFVMLSPQVTYYRIKDHERLDENYLCSFFRSPPCQSQLARMGKQSTRSYVSIRTQRKLRVPVLSIRAQRDLVAFLAEVDRAIAALERRRSRTRRLAVEVIDSEMSRS
jgi:type I restriction enzyme S subunit